MVEWLAVVAFCVGQQCGFWINTEKPYLSETECKRNLAQAEDYVKQNGAENVMSACVRLKWVKV